MANELVIWDGRDLAEYPSDAQIAVSHSDLVALADGTPSRPSRELDRRATQACEAVLRQAWGNEFEQRIEMNWKVLSLHMGEALAEDLLHARLDDGRRVADIPQLSAGLNELICLALAGLRAIEQGAAPASLESQKQEIERLMTSDFRRYQNEGWDRRYLEILEELGHPATPEEGWS